LLESIGYTSPVEYEEAYWRRKATEPEPVPLKVSRSPRKSGRFKIQTDQPGLPLHIIRTGPAGPIRLRVPPPVDLAPLSALPVLVSGGPRCFRSPLARAAHEPAPHSAQSAASARSCS